MLRRNLPPHLVIRWSQGRGRVRCNTTQVEIVRVSLSKPAEDIDALLPENFEAVAWLIMRVFLVTQTREPDIHLITK